MNETNMGNKLKRLIVALIGETGSGKSTIASICTDAEIHPIIAGKSGKKGTTKSVIEMTYRKDFYEFNIDEFKKSFEKDKQSQDGRVKIAFPLSTNIDLSIFNAMTILDTQGINDWKTNEEKDRVHSTILDACRETDIIFVTIPDGGSPRLG